MAPEIINCSQDIWKGQKRISHDNDDDDGSNGDLKSPGIQQNKRFKTKTTASPVLSAAIEIRARNPLFSDVNNTLLSPITEISNGLTETFISSSEDAERDNKNILIDTPKLTRGARNGRNLEKILFKTTGK